ncbi:unnamed protein product [Symbiodinium necroappetens]|uniref:Uncharacterized protein n=1 Tax=Symbiodinium necroappetens TaxID=1628268 RepID=A0A812JBH3_9DINO|nr:unnamed protein product [Symbiodinium necroappetens]
MSHGEADLDLELVTPDMDSESFSWSETSIWLEGSDFDQAVERLHSLYRLTGQRLEEVPEAAAATMERLPCSRARMDLGFAQGSFTAERIKEGTWYRNRWHTRATLDCPKPLPAQQQECDLCALNTWHSRPTYTYASVKSQLDYILMRSQDANHQAKLATPLRSFPVGAYRQTTHYPVQAAVRLLPMAYRAPQLKAEHRFEATALQSAVSQHSDSAQALLQAVEARLLALPAAQALCNEHDLVNTILLEETCRAFPPLKRVDQRVSAHEGYRASARGTWQLHRQMRQSGLPSLRNIWSRWRLYAQFLRASAQLRRQSKDLKRQFLEDQMRQAESAARKGNHRDLFLIACRLGPKKAQGVSRLQGPDGHVLDSKAEMAAIIKHSTAAFASTPDTTSLQPLRGSHSFTATELQAELGPCFEHHFRPLSTDKLEGDLQDWTTAVSDLTLQLETLETYQLKVNLQKTALLLNLKGKMAKKLLRQHTRHKAGETFLILTVHGQACIPPCLTYSLEVTGCTTKGLQRLKTIATRHVRAILREPAHLHHVSTSDIWERAKLPVPELSILARMNKLCERREPMHCPNGPDLVTNDKAVEHLNILIASLQEAIQRMTIHGLTSPEEAQQCINTGFPCPHCNLVQPTAHARLHLMGDPEAEIFAHCMPSGAAEDSQIRLLSKIILKHEEQLAALRKDTQFVLFFRQDDKSILPSLMNVSREWKAKQAAGDQSIQSSQRTVLISCLLRELLARMQRVVATEEGRDSLRKAEWLTSSNAWTYMRWSPKHRKLVADETREPMVHDEAVRIITELQKLMKGEIIHKFQSTVNLAKLEEQGAQQAIFHLGVSLRGSEAMEVYEQFRKLTGLSLTCLAGFRMKVDDQARPPMTQQLAQMTYGGGHYSVLSIGGAQSHVLDDEKPREPATNAFLESIARSHDLLKPKIAAMSEEKESGMNHFLLRKYGDTWTAAHLSLMEYQLKELEAQMMLMQRHVDNIQSQMHTLQLLVHRHSYLYSNRVTNKARMIKVRVLDTLD